VVATDPLLSYCPCSPSLYMYLMADL
jgi:hypothetical protein